MYKAKPTTLIARRGYSDLGAMTMTAAQVAEAKKTYAWKNGTCINIKTGMAYPGDQKLSNCQQIYGPPPTPGFWDAFVKYLPGGAGMPAGGGGIAPSGGMPSWVLPVAIGGGALVLVLVLRKK